MTLKLLDISFDIMDEPQNSWMCMKMLSDAMKNGFFSTIWKQRGNQCFGRHPFT
jgi:hypothetical protein